MRDLTDDELVEAVKAGSARAFDVIVQRYRAPVLRECHKVLWDWHEAEEAAQDTFVKARGALARFEPRGSLNAWLCLIARNSSRDMLRKRMRRLPVRESEEGSCDLNDPERLLLARDPRMQEAMARLRPVHAEALRLRVLEGFGHDEIGARLGMTGPKVKALLHRARAALRKHYETGDAA